LAYSGYLTYMGILIVLISWRVFRNVYYYDSSSFDIKLTLIDVCFIAILVTILVAAAVILIDRKLFIGWFNQILNADAFLQRLQGMHRM